MRALLFGTALALLMPITTAGAEQPTDTIFPLDGFYADMRYRYEHVEQDNFTNNATASTLRAKIGYLTNPFYDFTAGIELELLGEFGDEDYNNTVNSNTAYPVIADPDGAELNHLWLSYSGLPDTTVKFGRQPINLDNQRFIGTVGWRQNDQTYDAVAVTNTSLPDTSLLYAHVWNVNRVFGGDHPLGDLDTESHIMHASHDFADWLEITGYGYWLDIKRVPASSSKTFGLRLTGKAPIREDWSFFYQAEAAVQKEHGNNTNSFDHSYYHLAPGVKWQNFTTQIGYEVLEGDGTTAFQTPLATLHAHNGWADQFLTTPANGLEDIYLKAQYQFKGFNNWIDNTKLVGAFHDFSAENSGADYGTEWDLELSHPLPVPDFLDSGSVGLKFADYNAEDFGSDTQKFWFTVQFKF